MDNIQYQKAFVNRLNELMDEKGLNKTTLSVKTGIPRSTISNWLIFNRNPQIDALWKLSDFFGYPVGYILGKEN